jgi:flagellin
MISVNTNTAASQALQSLTAASSELQQAQRRTSTGLKVSSAKDDGATWSIAQNLRSNVASWQTVSDNISRGQSILDVAASGAASISDALSELKAKALSLNDSDLDTTSRAAIKNDMIAIIKQINNTALNADFNGVNLLNTPMGGGASQQISAPPMWPSMAGDQHMDYTLPQNLRPGTFTATFSAPAGSWHGFDIQMIDGTGLGAYTFDQPSQVQILHADKPVYNVGAWAPLGYDYLSIIYTPDSPIPDTIYNLVTDPQGGTTTLDHWDLTSGALGLAGLDWSNPSSILTAVTGAMDIVQRAATTIGSQQNGLILSQKGASVQQDTLQGGISNLVDADMAKEAAKLTAAQTRQQLATQTLAIANAMPQALLSLFH